MNLNPSTTPGSEAGQDPARDDLLRGLIAHGIRLIGVYGWTWVDWYELATVQADVLHQALQGRITDPEACLRLVACVGMHLTRDADGTLRVAGFRVPIERLRASPTKATACTACGARGPVSFHRCEGQEVLLVCRACGDQRPITWDLVRW